MLALLLAVAVYQDPKAPVEARVDDLFGRMTNEEKIAQLSGVDGFDLPANARLGIPKLAMTDGPIGVRLNDGSKATAFPAGVNSASSFNPELMGKLAQAMARETLALGRDMLLGPCVNIARAPHGGRNFESFGEDPFLAARLAEIWVTSLQAEKILASTKHYALNNQEVRRMDVDVRIGERAMHEIFLPAFLAAVKAETWTVMSAYNKINGFWASENDVLQNQILKKRWGYKGFVVSDWGATHSTVGAANGGLDVEMPSGEYFGAGKLDVAVKNGKVSQAVVDDKVRRVLRAMFAGGVFDRKPADRPSRDIIGGAAHRALAYEMASQSVVLLKNDGLLPFAPKSVAVIGPAADIYIAGGGSSYVTPTAVMTPVDAVRAAAPGASVTALRGVSFPGELRVFPRDWLTPPPGKGTGTGLYAEYFDNPKLEGKPKITQVDPPVNFVWHENEPWPGMPKDYFSMRWTGRLTIPAGMAGEYDLATRADDGTRLWLDGKLIIDDWSAHAPTTKWKRVTLEAGKAYDLKLEYFDNNLGAEVKLGYIPSTQGGVKDAVAAATKAEAVVVFAGTNENFEGEGNDRASLDLPEGQAELIEAVAAVNRNVVVVLQGGSPFLVDRWAGKVRAVLTAWYPGQEGSRAVADILFGKIGPSGKTPVTWPARWEDHSAFGRYPGGDSVDYSEGLYVGYRWFDKKKIEPRYAFGHGLSYTTFSYANAKATAEEISFDLKNTGKRDGAEVAQLYVKPEDPKFDRAEQELKGFARVALKAGESKRVTIKVGRAAFAHYDEGAHDWAVAPGKYTLRVGSSSRDIRLQAPVEVKP